MCYCTARQKRWLLVQTVKLDQMQTSLYVLCVIVQLGKNDSCFFRPSNLIKCKLVFMCYVLSYSPPKMIVACSDRQT